MKASESARGIDPMQDPLVNRGTAYSVEERDRLGLRGLLPPRVESIEEQAARVYENLRLKPTPIEQYVYLGAVRDDNETLFFRVLVDHLQELLPIVYTPTVGQACQEWSRRFLRPRGVYVTAQDAGHVRDLLSRVSPPGVGVIVVTDGGRILGLGDLGLNGMGIPIGKLALYTACAGIAPSRCLPVMLDVGTDTVAVRDDPYYLGLRRPRLAGSRYDALIEELVSAVQDVFPAAILQFEDFSNANAFRLLDRYRRRACTFNDDIQGTGAMGLAGLLAASRVTGSDIRAQRVLFAGAGEAALGIGSAVVAAMQRAGLSEAEARARCLFVDSKGTVVSQRTDLPEHKRAFAQDRASEPDLASTVDTFGPTVLIGASGQGGLFTRTVLEAMARAATRPVIFALSNPTSKSECTAEQAYAATDGRALFASGSPFAPVSMGGRTLMPGQANNSYIFPGVGLGVLCSGATRVTDEMFIAAAEALAGMADAEALAAGRVFPDASRLREVAATVATAVAAVAFSQGLATRVVPTDLARAIRSAMYEPRYE